MAQPRRGNADSQQESGGKTEAQPPQHRSTRPAPRQADDGTASVEKIDDETTDETMDETVNKETDTQAREGGDSPAGQDQDSGSIPTDGPTGNAPRTGVEDTVDTDAEASGDTDAEAMDETGTPSIGPSMKRRRSPASTRRHRRSPGQAVSRGVGVLTSFAPAAVVGGVTWWRHTAPTTPTPQLQALSLAQPGGTTTYICPYVPTNILRGTDVGTMESVTAIVSAKGDGADKSTTYTGRNIPADTATSISIAKDGTLTLASADDQVADAVGTMTTLAKSGNLRRLTAAPYIQPPAMSWIVGGSIAADFSAKLRLVNPDITPTIAKVTLYGSIGRFNLSNNGEITVPAGDSSSPALEAKGSQDSHITAPVETDGGSVVSILVTEPLDGETPADTDVATSGATPATDLVIPSVETTGPTTQDEVPDVRAGADSSDSPAMRIVNPGTTPTTMPVAMLGKDDTRPLGKAQSMAIDAGSIFDTQLVGVPAGTYGVQITSNVSAGAAIRVVRGGGEYPMRSKAPVHDQAWAQATLPGVADPGLLTVPRAASLNSTVTVASSDETTSAILPSFDSSQKQDVKAAKDNSGIVKVPAKTFAVHLNAAGRKDSSETSHAPSGLAITTIMTAQAGEDLAGTLISTVPAQPDTTVQAQRRIPLD